MSMMTLLFRVTKLISTKQLMGKKSKIIGGNERVGFYQEDQLVAVASILIQPLPLGFSMLYIPRGPIMDYQNKELVSFVIQSLKR